MDELKPWVELARVLDDKGLKLVDVSRDSKRDEYRTEWSIQYLCDLRAGRRGAGPQGPDIRVLADLARVLGVDKNVLRRADSVPRYEVPATITL